MRRLVGSVAAGLLVAMGSPLAAQRPGAPTAVKLEEPRPAPVFPVAIVPFSIPAELCRGGRVPAVTLKVHDAIAKPVQTLRLRTRDRQPLDGLQLRCGRYVAFWDGTIDDGARIAPAFVYYLQLTVNFPDTAPLRDTFKLVVPPN